MVLWAPPLEMPLLLRFLKVFLLTPDGALPFPDPPEGVRRRGGPLPSLL